MIQPISYINIEYTDYLMNRSKMKKEWDALSQDDKQILLNRSTYLLDTSFAFYGRKFDLYQQLEFPRQLEYLSPSNGVIPQSIKIATFIIVEYLMSSKNYENILSARAIGMKEIVDGTTSFSIEFVNQIPSLVMKYVYPYTLLGYSHRNEEYKYLLYPSDLQTYFRIY
jgi:hypothetical protein